MIQVKRMNRITFDYVNWRGESSTRYVLASRLYYGSNEWHKEDQWLLEAWDYDKNEKRLFAMKDMSNIKSMST